MPLQKLKDKTVLIVEDDPINNELLVFILKKAKMKSLSAFNGKEALEIFGNHPEIDLVLMDIKMPGMNGYEITNQMKKKRPQLPVIAQTAYALAGDRELALEAGCDDYIKKPIAKDLLYEIMKNLL